MDELMCIPTYMSCLDHRAVKLLALVAKPINVPET